MTEQRIPGQRQASTPDPVAALVPECGHLICYGPGGCIVPAAKAAQLAGSTR